jgi:transcriptional regulator with XRE-family HTH domain
VTANSSELELRQRFVGRFLRESRLRAHLTQFEVASHLRYSTPQFISNWERGISLPPLTTMPRIAALYSISAREFIAAIHGFEVELLKLRKKEVSDIFRSTARSR